MKKLARSGFTMIELLVVLLIIGILAAVAAPLFIQNSDKARASEAVNIAGSIRTGERTYKATGGGFLAVTDGSTYFSGAKSDLGVVVQGQKYWSPKAFTVGVTASDADFSSAVGANPIDYVITADGSLSQDLTTDTNNGARSAADVSAIRVKMDGSGTAIISTDSGSTWSKF
jgi:prepilin-type N-terminal cleavage/methylation domain-containing protein